jgi:hypothetical protein
VIRFLQSLVDFMKQHRPAAGDSFNTFLGYLCGLWDGIVDSLTGLLETLALGLGLLAAFLKASLSPRIAFQAALEGLDQLLQALGRINWLALWNHFVSETFPKIVHFLTEHAPTLIVDKIAANTATVGYYFGYVAYNIAEAFFPPVKLGKVAKGVDAADGVANLVRRALTA